MLHIFITLLELHASCRVRYSFNKSAKPWRMTGVPGWIRTSDLRIRNPLLYPAELRAHEKDDNSIRIIFKISRLK